MIVASAALTVLAVVLLAAGLALRNAPASLVAVACCLAASGCLVVAVRRRSTAAEPSAEVAEASAGGD